MRSFIVLASLVVFAACSAGGTPDAPSASAPPPASSAPPPTPPPAPQDAIGALGLAERYARAPDPRSAACARFRSRATETRAQLDAVRATHPEAATSLLPHLKQIAGAFSKFEGALLGEIKRSHGVYAAAGVEAAELEMVMLDLHSLLRSAAIPDDVRDAFASTLGGLADRSPTSEARAALETFVVGLAIVLSNLDLCAPAGA